MTRDANYSLSKLITSLGFSPSEQILFCWDFLGGASGKESPYKCRRHERLWVWSLGQEDLLEKGMATHSNILAWRIPRDRAAWWATVLGAAESDTTEPLSTTCCHQWFIVVFSRLWAAIFSVYHWIPNALYMVGAHYILFLFIYLWLHWVFVAVQAFTGCSKQGLLFIVARGPCTSHCGGFSWRGAQTPGTQASEVVVHRLSCPTALGIFPN